MFNKTRLVFVAIALAATAAMACDCIEFKQPTALMATPTLGSAYVTFVSDKDDVLTTMRSPCCEAVELHSMKNEDGVMRMRKLEKLDLKAGIPVELKQGGELHLMLIGVKKAYKPGQQFPVTFHLEKEGDHKATFHVVKRGAAPAKEATMDHGAMEGMHHH